MSSGHGKLHAVGVMMERDIVSRGSWKIAFLLSESKINAICSAIYNVAFLMEDNSSSSWLSSGSCLTW